MTKAPTPGPAVVAPPAEPGSSSFEPKPITLRPGVTHWVELPRETYIDGFLDISIGVVATFRTRQKTRERKLAANDRFVPIPIVDPAYEIFLFGRWPDQLWRAVPKPVEVGGHLRQQFSFEHWRGKGFISQAKLEFEGKVGPDPKIVELRRSDFEQPMNTSHAGGMLVYDPHTDAVYSSPDFRTPRPYARNQGDRVLQIYGAESGALFYLLHHGEGPEARLLLTPPCSDGPCIEGAYGIPIAQVGGVPDGDMFWSTIGRGGDSMSFLWPGMGGSILVHYDPQPPGAAADPWSAELLPFEAWQLWPDGRGGLFTASEDEETLAFRDPSGDWLKIEAPPDSAFLDFAMRNSPRELIALSSRGEDKDISVHVFAARSPVTPARSGSGSLPGSDEKTTSAPHRRP